MKEKLGLKKSDAVKQEKSCLTDWLCEVSLLYNQFIVNASAFEGLAREL